MVKLNKSNSLLSGSFFKLILNALFIKSFTILFSLLGNIFLSRGLEPEGRAEFFVTLAYVNIIANFSYFGIPTSNMYYVSKDSSSIKTHLFHSLVISLIGSIIGVLFVLFFLKGFDYKILFYYIIQIPNTMLSLMIGGLLISLKREKEYFKIEVVTPIMMVILYSIGWFLHQEVNYYVFSNLISILGTTLLGLFFLRTSLVGKINHDNKLLFKKLKFSFKVYITTILAYLINKGSIFFLNHYSSQIDVGNYSLVTQLSDAFALIPTTISTFLFPGLLNLEYKDQWVKLKKVLKYMFYILIFISLCILIFSKFIIIILFGEKFGDSALMLKYSIPSIAFLSLSGIVSQYLAANNYPMKLSIIWFCVFIIWLLSSFIIVPILGGIGSSITMSISYCFLFLLLYRLSKKTYSTIHDNFIY